MLNSFAVTYLANDNSLNHHLFLKGQSPSGKLVLQMEAMKCVIKLEGAYEIIGKWDFLFH